MSGFFGKDMQQRLQAEAEVRTDYIRQRPVRARPDACSVATMWTGSAGT